MFLKLQRLLSQQAVLIKTMFHLFLMIINCPCNEKKTFLLGRLYHPVVKQVHHRQASTPTYWGLENSSRDWPPLLPLPAVLTTSSLCGHGAQVSGGFATSSLPKTTSRLERGASLLGTKEGVSRKGGSSCRPSASICPAIPPSCEQAGLDVPSNLNQVKRDFQINP